MVVGEKCPIRGTATAMAGVALDSDLTLVRRLPEQRAPRPLAAAHLAVSVHGPFAVRDEVDARFAVGVSADKRRPAVPPASFHPSEHSNSQHTPGNIPSTGARPALGPAHSNGDARPCEAKYRLNQVLGNLKRSR